MLLCFVQFWYLFVSSVETECNQSLAEKCSGVKIESTIHFTIQSFVPFFFMTSQLKVPARITLFDNNYPRFHRDK